MTMATNLSQGTFDIWRLGDLWTATDTDTFNNWGSETFARKADAIAYAKYALEFKEGRTFRNFHDWKQYRAALEALS
jgi:hypothetical protein